MTEVQYRRLILKKHRLQEQGSKILRKVADLRRRIEELEDDYNVVESDVLDINKEIEGALK
jgi:predicted nuclease with TOPRIM domain